jgi:hypothetical protein
VPPLLSTPLIIEYAGRHRRGLSFLRCRLLLKGYGKQRRGRPPSAAPTKFGYCSVISFNNL